MNKSPRTLRTFLFCSTWTLLIHPTSSCDTGWFGSRCQFKCHCSSECNTTNGECTEGAKCAMGWFGLQCQKQDLLTIAHTTITLDPEQTSYPWLTDNDDATCNDDQLLESINVTWFKAYVFTWMRYTLKEDAEGNDIQLTFYDGNNTALPCSDSQTIKLTARSFEVHCVVPVGVHKVMVEGDSVNETCTMHINGGQNFALKIQVSESSALDDIPSAYRAVDGDTSGDFEQQTCTHSKHEDAMPTLVFNFPRSYRLNRFVVYNRNDQQGKRLKRFLLEAFDEDGKRVLRYKENDKSMGFKTTYEVLKATGWQRLISKVEISQTQKSDTDYVPVLTVCELETYGECPPRTWNLECEECVGCYNDTCVWDTGFCIQGCAGYNNPPVCTEPCDPGFWGLNCTFPCISSHCLNNSCNKDTGICDVDCARRYTGYPNCTVACFEHCVNDVCNVDTLECTEGCQEGWYGLQCTKECSNNCQEPGCNVITGHCTRGCVPGWFSAQCNEMCPENCTNNNCSSEVGLCLEGCTDGLYGDSCTEVCPENCVNQSCNFVNGFCEGGCADGWFGESCNKVCSSRCVGNMCGKQGNCLKGCTPPYGGIFCQQQGGVSEDAKSSSGIFIILLVALIVASALAALGFLARQHHITVTTHRHVGETQE